VARLDYLVTGVSTSGSDIAMLRYMLLTLHVFYVPWFLYHMLAGSISIKFVFELRVKLPSPTIQVFDSQLFDICREQGGN